MKFDFDYSSEDDVLSIFNYNLKPEESIEFSENIKLDINKQGGVVGLEIYNASEFLGSFREELNKSFLSDLKEINLIEKSYRNMWHIILVMQTKSGITIEQTMPLLNKVEYKSPLLSLN
jgi:uncharacterized protein YuzE